MSNYGLDRLRIRKIKGMLKGMFGMALRYAGSRKVGGRGVGRAQGLGRRTVIRISKAQHDLVIAGQERMNGC
jgi:hypothetical protein